MMALDDSEMQSAVDQQVVTAACSFTAKHQKSILDYSGFLGFIGNFIQHLFRFGNTPSLIFSSYQATAQGLDWLYKTKNFDAIYLSTLKDPIQGKEQLIQVLTEAAIEHFRNVYTSGIFLRLINPWDYNLQYELTEIFLKELRPHFPKHLQNLPVSIFVPNLPDLFFTELHQAKTIKKILNRVR